MEGELESLEVQIAELQQRQKQLTKRRDALLLHLEEACDVATPSSSKSKSSQAAAVMSKQELQRYDNAGTGSTCWVRHHSLHNVTSIKKKKLSPRFFLVQRRGAAPEGLVSSDEV